MKRVILHKKMKKKKKLQARIEVFITKDKMGKSQLLNYFS